jgi:Pvc16 N-terminal domain
VATYRAIAAIGETLAGILRDASADTEFDGFRFELYQASDFESEEPFTEGITIYLYRVAINATRRSLPPAVGPDGRRFRAPLPVDLYYLLTPWARSAAMQHRLLGWVMRELHNVSILPAAVLNHYVPEDDTFRANETVELVCDSVSVQDMMNILEPADLNEQLSVVYVARMIALESTIPLDESGPVQTRVFDYGEVTDR